MGKKYDYCFSSNNAWVTYINQISFKKKDGNQFSYTCHCPSQDEYSLQKIILVLTVHFCTNWQLHFFIFLHEIF